MASPGRHAGKGYKLPFLSSLALAPVQTTHVHTLRVINSARADTMQPHPNRPMLMRMRNVAIREQVCDGNLPHLRPLGDQRRRWKYVLRRDLKDMEMFGAYNDEAVGSRAGWRALCQQEVADSYCIGMKQ